MSLEDARARARDQAAADARQRDLTCKADVKARQLCQEFARAATGVPALPIIATLYERTGLRRRHDYVERTVGHGWSTWSGWGKLKLPTPDAYDPNNDAAHKAASRSALAVTTEGLPVCTQPNIGGTATELRTYVNPGFEPRGYVGPLELASWVGCGAYCTGTGAPALLRYEGATDRTAFGTNVQVLLEDVLAQWLVDNGL